MFKRNDFILHFIENSIFYSKNIKKNQKCPCNAPTNKILSRISICNNRGVFKGKVLHKCGCFSVVLEV